MIDVNKLDKKRIAELLRMEDFSEIYANADRVRHENVGDEIQMRAIIEFSNCCKKKCTYCGLACDNNHLERFRMKPDEITDAAAKAIEAGYKTIVLQSGEDDWFTRERLGDIIAGIKEITFPQRCPSCRTVAAMKPAVTLSVGERPQEDYEYWRKKGADRYLLKHETANRKLFAEMHPDGDFDGRIDCLRVLKSLGYETGSGFMVGLPGQTAEDLADNLLLLKELECDMAGIGPYIENPKCRNRPKGGAEANREEMAKRCVAIARLLLPKANLPVTTAARVLGENAWEAHEFGANVIMNKFTPEKYRKSYEIYPVYPSETGSGKGGKNDRV